MPKAKAKKAKPKKAKPKQAKAKKVTRKPAARTTKRATKKAAKPKPARAATRTASPSSAPAPRTAKKLMDAASQGDLAVVTALLARGCDPNELYQDSPALAWAVWKGYPDVAKALLAAGANPNLGKSYPCAGGAMHAAADSGSVEMLELLLAAGGDVNVVGQSESCRPLFRAASKGHAAAVRLLLERGADPLLDVGGKTAIREAASGGSTEVLDLLHARGAPLRGSGRSPLIQALYSRKPDAVRWLLAHGCDPNEHDGAAAALHIAAGRKEGGPELIDVLVAAGADIDARELSSEEEERPTALQRAVHEGYPDNVARLLHHGADRTLPTLIPDWPTLLDMAKHHLSVHPPEDWGDHYTRIVDLLQRPR